MNKKVNRISIKNAPRFIDRGVFKRSTGIHFTRSFEVETVIGAMGEKFADVCWPSTKNKALIDWLIIDSTSLALMQRNLADLIRMSPISHLMNKCKAAKADHDTDESLAFDREE